MFHYKNIPNTTITSYQEISADNKHYVIYNLPQVMDIQLQWAPEVSIQCTQYMQYITEAFAKDFLYEFSF